MFYFHWIEPIKETLLKNSLRKGYWEQTKLKGSWKSWSGYAFEAICEIKYTDKPFKIDKEYSSKLLNKAKVFKTRTRINKQIFIAMESASGVNPSMYSEEIIDGVVTLDDLFARLLIKP